MSIGERFATKNEVEVLRRKIQLALSGATISQPGPDIVDILYFIELSDVPEAYTAAGNFIVRVKSTIDQLEFAELKGTTNQVYVAFNAADYTLSLPQDIHTAATPTFAGMYLQSASAAPFLKITNVSDTERDPIIQWAVGATPVTKFTMGVDDSDTDDAFRIDKGAALGANLVLYSGNTNAIFGEGACLNVTMADILNNVIIGYRACQYTGITPFIGDGNVIIGADAALYIEGNDYDNVILGHEAIQYICDSSYGNVIVGAHAGFSATGGLTRTVLLGYYANCGNDLDNVIVIGANVSAGPTGNECIIGRRWDDTDPAPVIIRSGSPEPSDYKLDLWHAGTAKSITSLVRIVNPITAADMDGTGVGLLFGLRAYDAGGGDQYYDAAHIVAVTETDWLEGTLTTIDSYLGFYTSLDGVLAEKIRISSAGNLGLGQTTFGTSATKTLAISTGTAPSSNPADCFQNYSADAGGIALHAAPHWMCEAGGMASLECGAGTVNEYRYYADLADDAILTLPFSITSSARGFIAAGNNEERSDFWIDNDGDVTLMNNSANVVANADTDDKLDIGTAAAQEPLQIKNRLNATKKISLVIWYN